MKSLSPLTLLLTEMQTQDHKIKQHWQKNIVASQNFRHITHTWYNCLSAFPEFGVATADFTVESCIFDLAGLLQLDALSAANLLKEENARRRFFAHASPPEIWLLFGDRGIGGSLTCLWWYAVHRTSSIIICPDPHGRRKVRFKACWRLFVRYITAEIRTHDHQVDGHELIQLSHPDTLINIYYRGGLRGYALPARAGPPTNFSKQHKLSK